MKNLLTIVFLCIGLSAYAGPKYVGSFVGDGSGLTNIPASALSANVVTNNGTLTLGLPFVGNGARGGYTSNALTGVNITNASGTVSMQTVIGSTNWVGSDGKISTFSGAMNFNQGAGGVFNFGNTGLSTQDGHVIAGDFTATLSPGFIGSGQFSTATIGVGIITNAYIKGITNAVAVGYADGRLAPTNSLETLTNVIVTGAGGQKISLGGHQSGTTNLLEITSGSTLVANIETNGLAHMTLNATNVTVNSAVLVSSGNQTNYTIPLLPGVDTSPLTIYLANTNVFFTFTGTNIADNSRTVLLRAWTNTVDSTLRFVSAVRTNYNFNSTVTNGWSKVLNFYNVDTTGSNVLVTDGGRWR